ncbi:MAG: class I SAM-dependent methyltransferase [Gammaproteobacteria bacterium]|nr:class I SAM-dependent methyltransferase [Gammaproteobacteria bacterium]NNJ95747.1 class I SAM-dependent methyltransferase [Gammaproteobacteria bacterium]
MKSSSVCIVCSDQARTQQAHELARWTGLPVLDKKSADFALQLCFETDRVMLYDTMLNTSIHVDFVSGALAHRRQFGGGRDQAIAKAVGLKHGRRPNVLDITAGLCRDAYVLASLGCKLFLVEQSPVVYTLIEDGIRRGQSDTACAEILKNFISWINADAIEYMRSINSNSRPDVIYIDPMYPDRKKSALVKKDMQILQRLLPKDQYDDELLTTALDCAAERVVVKRPLHAPALGDVQADTSISSKKTRFDVYLVKNNQ